MNAMKHYSRFGTRSCVTCKWKSDGNGTYRAVEKKPSQNRYFGASVTMASVLVARPSAAAQGAWVSAHIASSRLEMWLEQDLNPERHGLSRMRPSARRTRPGSGQGSCTGFLFACT